MAITTDQDIQAFDQDIRVAIRTIHIDQIHTLAPILEITILATIILQVTLDRATAMKTSRT